MYIRPDVLYVYKTIISLHCATLLIDMGETQLNKLQKVQNRAIRVILQCDICTKVDCMLQLLQYYVRKTEAIL